VAEALVKGTGNPCTEVQVFHRRYRENEAKTGAKVGLVVTILFSCIYETLIGDGAVLAEKFRTKNVTCVPSPLGLGRCQMGQVGGVIDHLDRLAHLIK